VRKKRQAYDRTRNKGDRWETYRNQKKCQKYINSIVSSENKNSNKGFWSYIKKFKTDSVGISVLKREGRTATTPEDKANMLSDQFSSVFTSEDTDNLPTMTGDKYPDIGSIHVTIPGVVKLLRNLDPSKAAGPDGITSHLLKETSNELAPILTVIFQHSLDTGQVPHEWKTAQISPIYKKENRCTPANYRPVSLTCICSKLLEHIVNHHIMEHLDNNNILVNCQHGFRRRRSCETQLLLTYNDLVRTVDRSGQVDILVLDFAKAFDTVAHHRLLDKLKHYGINSKLHAWISSYLIGRMQSVWVNGEVPSRLMSSQEYPKAQY